MMRLCLTLFFVSSAMGLVLNETSVLTEKKAGQEKTQEVDHKVETKVESKVDNKVDKPLNKVDKLKTYQFADFVRQFKRSWQPGTAEWKQREDIFKKNLQTIIAHHSGPAQPWSKDVNKFMDYTEQEFKKLLGHKPGKRGMAPGSLLQTGKKEPAPLNMSFVTLPVTHDWRSKLAMSGKFARDQGACGSCWAFAAVQALEGHLEIQHGKSSKLSAQFLVSCMPNELHCGGTGGCDGATANLAFDYIKEFGIPAEQHWPYTSFSGRDGTCNPALKANRHVNIQDWVHLPENKDGPLAQALYQHGPVVVSVDGNPWSLYSSGIFAGCNRNAIINHAVVAEGFGEELHASTKKLHKYYLIKNSWGNDWGENGYIRLERFEDDNAYCGIDNKPEEGNGCDGGPREIPVCGMCGVTSDSSFPMMPTFVENAGFKNPLQSLGQVTPNEILKKGFQDLIKRR